MTAPAVPTVPAASASRLPASTLLALARRGLVEACGAATPGERYAAAHLAALRVAAAVLACRARPVAGPSRRRPTSAWVLLADVAPELGEWAAFFAAGARKRAAAEAGLPSAVTPREADDLVREVEAFLAMVEASLGAPARSCCSGPADGARWTPSSTCTSPPATRCGTAPRTRACSSSARPSTAWTPSR
jgi:hypothetical protein